MDTQNNEKIRSGNKIVLIIQFILTVIGVGALALDFVTGPKNASRIVFYALSMIVYIMTVVYATSGYKKPHGNLLKDCFILYIGALGVQVVCLTLTDSNFTIVIACFVGVIILASYMCGRLDRIKENKVLIIIVIALLLARVIAALIPPLSQPAGPDPANLPDPSGMPAPPPESGLGWRKILTILSNFAPMVQWITLSMAYLFRYHLHKEAGLKSSKDCE